RAAFDAAAAPEFPPERRFLALVRRADYECAAGRPDAARAVARMVVDSDDLSRVSLRDADGMFRSAREWAKSRVVVQASGLPSDAPWCDRPGWRDPDAVAPAGRLSGFRWAGGRLVARLGERSLLALDGATGAVLWQRSAPLTGPFHPAYFADERCVAAQSAD